MQRMVRESAAGRTQRELCALLHVPVHAFLLAAVRQQALRRERMGGVWAYRSSDAACAGPGTLDAKAPRWNRASSSRCFWRCCGIPDRPRHSWRAACRIMRRGSPWRNSPRCSHASTSRRSQAKGALRTADAVAPRS